MSFIVNLPHLDMNKAVIAVIAVVIIGGISVYALAPYFTESTVNEDLPTGAIIQSKTDDKDAMMMEKEDDDAMMMEKEDDDAMMMEKEDDDAMMMEKEDDDAMMMEKEDDDAMMMEKEDDDAMMMEKEDDDAMMMEKEDDDAMMMEKEDDDAMMMEKEDDDAMMMEKEEMVVPMSYTGNFIGVGDGIHDAQGDAYTIPLEDGSNVLRLENFESTNGPDLYVYLSTDDRASEFINLGELKANKGNQNYEIPTNADLEKYDKVLIWCKAFGVLFGSAELSSN